MRILAFDGDDRRGCFRRLTAAIPHAAARRCLVMMRRRNFQNSVPHVLARLSRSTRTTRPARRFFPVGLYWLLLAVIRAARRGVPAPRRGGCCWWRMIIC
jgi:hypothetical protein